MSLLDVLNQFSDNQSVTASAKSTDNYDSGAAVRDIGAGKPLYIQISVQTALAGTGSVAVKIQQADNATFTSGAQMGNTIATMNATNGTKGASFYHTIAPGEITKRYFRLDYARSGTISAGAVDAYLTPHIDTWRAYKAGSTIKTTNLTT